MQQEYIQNIRYKLQKRVRRLNSIDQQFFPFALKQFWHYLENDAIYRGLLDELEIQSTKIEDDIKSILEGTSLVFDTEQEQIIASYSVLKTCALSENTDLVHNISFTYGRQSSRSENLDYFRDFFLEPFYEYLDEGLDSQSLMLFLLNQYKHKSEWFKRDSLYDIWENNTQKGEKLLALNLYEYLHDQGVQFSIEPSSISGEADIVSSQKDSEPLIADAKIFNPEKSQGADYIAKGFRQVYDYLLDYNEAFGYLIIYKTADTYLRFAFPNADQSTPYFQHNNKTIFFIVVDIFPHAKSASKRGKMKNIDLTEEKLIKAFED